MAAPQPPLNEPPLVDTGPEHRFFTWTRSLGIVRQPGWIGGVCAGIAARLGIDPLIVRGIVLVVAVLGGPALLLYAAAWLLLPDHTDKIHLEQVIRGKFESPVAGIGALLLLSMLPLTQGFWFAGSAYWGEPRWDVSVWRAIWTVAVLASIVWFVIWIARHSARTPDPVVSPATTDDRPDTIPQPRPKEASETFAAPPPSPAADAPAEEFAAWREKQALWKQQNVEWKAQRAATERELRQQRAAEARGRALASAAQAAELRRLHRLANPRITAAAGWGAIGAAIFGGGAAAILAAGNPDLAGYEVTVAFATASIILGLAIVTAGALRRRSGILSFLSVIAIVATLATAMVPRDRELLGPSAGIGAGGNIDYAQVVGRLHISVDSAAPSAVTDVWQGSGDVTITVFEEAAARIEVISRDGEVVVWALQLLSGDEYEARAKSVGGVRLNSEEWLTSVAVGPANATTQVQTIRIWQGNGRVEIYDQNKPLSEEVDE